LYIAKARSHVEPLALGLEAEIVAALDVSKPGKLEALFETIRENWGVSICAFTLSPGRFRDGDGYFVPFLRADGEACSASNG
jgi:enoyl-[acyl-carrier protein] reductase I